MRKLITILALVFLGCQNNEADVPELRTEEAQQIGATSVVMEAGITEIGPVRPMKYGILWDKQSDLSIVASANKNILGSADGPRKFSIKVDNLSPSTTYYYRGFAANDDYSKIYYSNVVTFTTLP
jgi:hypothetical protein